jgi:hypothetical protein
MRLLNPRSGAHVVTVLLALVLGATALAGPASSATPTPTEDPTDDATRLLDRDAVDEEPRRRPRPDFKVATLNLQNSMGADGIRHDLRKIRRAGATVIGMQERRGTRRMVRAALPDHWRLAMPTTKDGTDDNPVAWNSRVWELRRTWPRLLAKKTWHRDGYGNQAIEQYAVTAVLEHRRSGHVIRAASLHMPNEIQTEGGGPRWSERDNLRAFWRMSDNLRELATRTPDRQQFVTMCDCNVSHGRDHTRHLLKGKVTRPRGLMSNYSEGGYRRGWRIDYVLAERRKPYVIEGWSVHHDLRTDHPGVVTRFGHR